MRIPLVVMAMVPAAALAGCIVATDPADTTGPRDAALAATQAPVRLLEDPTDDAVLYDAPLSPPIGGMAGACVRDLACASVLRAGRETVVCAGDECAGVGDVDPDVPASPAPPALDIQAIDLVETSETLLFGLVLGEASPSFEGAFVDDEIERVVLGVSWRSDAAPCSYQLDQWVLRTRGAVHPRTPLLFVRCEDDGTRPARCVLGCLWALQVEVQQGAPGVLRFLVPRHVLPDGEAGSSFEGLGASIVVTRTAAGRSMWQAPWIEAWPDTHYGYASYWLDTTQIADATTDDGAFTLELEPAPPPAGAPVTTPDSVGDVATDEYRPVLDALAMSAADTPETLSLTWEMAEVSDDPTTRQVFLLFSLPSGDAIRAAVGVSHGEPFLSASRFNGTGFEDRQSVDIPVGLDVVAGTPGSITLTFDRADLDNPRAGDLLSGPTSFVHWFEDWVEVPVLDAAATADGGIADAPRLAPFRFEHGTSPPAADGATTTVQDASSDVRPPQAFTGNAYTYDVTFARAQPENEHAALSVGIADATSLQPPAPYDAALWAVAARTDAGAVMVGYLQPRGQDEGSFFCAPDTMVLDDAKRVPAPAERQEVPGRLVRGEPGGGIQPATFTWSVPRACFGLDEGSGLEASELRAGTYLVGPAVLGGAVVTMDEAVGDGPIALMSAAAPAATPRSWFTDAEWLLLALGAALVTAEIAVFALRHGRRDERAEDRLVGYRRVLEREVRAERSSKEIAEHLKPLRAALGISDREHARLEAEVRTRLAAALGGGRALVPGERFLDRYEVVRRLPAGSGGRAYACRDARLGRDVVLKVLSAPGERELDALMREARAFAAVRHESVVTLYDVERVGDEAFLVLEHVDGGSLRERLARGPLSRDEILCLGDDLLSALGAVHAAGIVHRDVKPANVLVAGDGRFKLADFGIAHVAGRDVTAAGFGTDGAAGTLRYMSPEQARGERVDARSDLFSAAATLYEAWTGTPYVDARDGESVTEVQLRVASARGSLERCRGPERLRAFFARALAGAPDGRFQDADAMRVALLDALRAVEGRDAAAMLHGPAE